MSSCAKHVSGRPLGWAFAPAGSIGTGLCAGVVFSAIDNVGYTPEGIAAILVCIVVSAVLAVVGSRRQGALRDAALGFGVGGPIAVIVVVLTLSGSS